VPASFLQKALKSGVQNMFLPTMVIRDDLPVGSFAPSSFPSLHRLNLNESRAPLSFMTRFVASLSSLRWIDLYACRVVTDDVVDAIAASSPLVSFFFKIYFLRNDKCIQKLQHANLSGTDITAVGVNNLLQSAPLLETLFVAWCPNLTGIRKQTTMLILSQRQEKESHSSATRDPMAASRRSTSAAAAWRYYMAHR